MKEEKTEQLEALQVFGSYNERLIKSIQSIVLELEGERKKDTDEFLEGIIKVINWEVSVLGNTMSLINEEKESIKKEEINDCIIRISKALEKKIDSEIAKELKEALPMFEKLGEIVGETVKRNEN
ncbi:MAG: molecular chaperone [Lachnospiraceae bacterium]|nr:molecular chaperone [Lachnospiraceae bacterium]